MNVLVACEYSGTVRDAFIAKGHNAISCDLLPTDKAGPHVEGDVLPLLKYQWDLIVAHPPCTFISNAGAKHLYKGKVLNHERYEKGMKYVKFFMQFLNADCPKICVENPIPSKVFELPKYTQTIQPFEHGHPFQKKTCLWLKGLPPLMPTDIRETRENTKSTGNWFNKGGKDRQKNRAKTFSGIATAMAGQWGSND